MRVLILGYGSMGRRHAQAVAGLGHYVLVHDTDLGRLGQAVMDGHGTVRALASALGPTSAPEAIVVATPAATHAPLLRRALTETAAIVYVEKPVAETVEAAEAAVAGCAATRVTVGYQLRFHAGALAVKQVIEDREIGAPQRCWLTLVCDMGAWPGRDYASALLECSHEVDLARWWFGDAAVYSAQRLDGDWLIRWHHQASDVLTDFYLMPRRAGVYRRDWVVMGCEGGDLAHRWREDRVQLDLDGRPVLTGDARELNAAASRAAVADWLAGGRSGARLADGLAAVRLLAEARGRAEHEAQNRY